jgi:ElaB/YqjD/DUF883 family membrane-anchored ribosome-binding protein
MDMASEPVPERLVNQEVRSEEESTFPKPNRPRPELVGQAAPPIPAERELPRAPRREEWKGAVQQKLEEVKEAASRAGGTGSMAMQKAKERATTAVAHAKDRAADVYRESRAKAASAFNRTRSRASYLLDEYPLHVIAGLAAVGFVAGVLLRVWRSSRDA